MLKNLYELVEENSLKVGDTVIVFNRKYPDGMEYQLTDDWYTWSAVNERWWACCDKPDEPSMIAEKEDNFKPYLYAIMRTDIPQMNPGKGMAQAMHLQQVASQICEQGIYRDIYDKWKRESRQGSFGTTIVLEGSSEDARKLQGNIIEEYKNSAFDFIGFAQDDEYPMKKCVWRILHTVSSYWVFYLCSRTKSQGYHSRKWT